MLRIYYGVFVGMALLILGVLGCDQDEVTFPGASVASGECGSWYAADEEEKDVVTYAVKEGSTFPCLVWSSVRLDGEDTWFNAGELYMEVKNGVSDKKALLLMVSGQSCPACIGMINGLKKFKDRIDAVADVISVNRGEPALDAVYSLDEAVEVLTGEGWPSDWPITNDIEDYVLGFESFPWIIVVRLEDMAVMEVRNDKYSGGNVETLVETLESF